MATYKKQPKVLMKKHYAPKLFQFFESLSEYIGCKKPNEFYVTNETNISITFVDGIAGMFSGKTALLIGMPLVAGMSLQQFSGMVAREYGHFAQGRAVYIRFTINAINKWLYARAYKKDKIDEKIESYLKDHEVMTFLSIICQIVKFGFRLPRWIFQFLYKISLRCSYDLSRKFEFDADRYEVNVTGSSVFEQNAINLQVLNLSKNQVDKIILQKFHDTATVFEDIPLAVANIAKKYDEKAKQRIQKRMRIILEVWSANPADHERVVLSQQRNEQGLDIPLIPAAKLFGNVAVLNKKVSRQYYREYLSIADPKKYMVSNKQIQS